MDQARKLGETIIKYKRMLDLEVPDIKDDLVFYLLMMLIQTDKEWKDV